MNLGSQVRCVICNSIRGMHLHFVVEEQALERYPRIAACMQ